jgi:hypothetical protein
MMRKHTISCVHSIAMGLFAATFVLDPGRSLAARECTAQPGAPAQGGHWYYRLDRASNRKCWYLLEGAANPQRDQTSQQQSALQAAQQPSLFSLFSALPGFSSASLPATPPVSMSSDARGMPIALPQASKSDDAVRAKPRRHADAKAAPASKLDRQVSGRPSKPVDEPRVAPPNQAERDALFQEFVRWQLLGEER